jgi:hypothetical protein
MPSKAADAPPDRPPDPPRPLAQAPIRFDPASTDSVEEDDEDDEDAEPAFEDLRSVSSVPPTGAGRTFDVSSTAAPQPAAVLSEGGLDLAAMRRKVIDALRKDRNMLASGLAKSLAWEIVQDRVIIPATDRLAAELLRKDHQAILSAVVEAAGKPLSLEVVERAPASTGGGIIETGEDIQPQVEMVRRMFRGTIVRNV